MVPKSAKPPMSEAQLQKTIVEMARRLGWKVAHFGRGQGRGGAWFTPVAADAKGFPDLVLVHKGKERPQPKVRLLFLELKAPRGRPTLEQEEWLSLLARVPCVGVYMVDPGDLANGFIESLLR